MKKQYNSWETQLGQRLQQLKGQPPANAWERLEAELDQKPRRSAWWMAATIGLLLSSGAYISWQLADTYRPQLVSDRSEMPGHPHSSPKQQDTEAVSPELEEGRKTVAHSPVRSDQTGRTAASTPAPEPDRNPTTLTPTSAPPAGSGLAAARISPSTSTPAGTGEAGISLPIAQEISKAGKPGGILATATPLASEALPPNRIPAAEGEKEMGIPRLAARRPEGFPLRYSLKAPRVERPQEDWYAVVTPEKEDKKGRKALLWTELMPTWSYRKVEPNPADAVVITSMESQPAFSGSRLGAQAALGVSLPVRKNLEWKTGAFYGMQQEQWSYTYRNAQADYYSTRISAAGEYTVVPEYLNRTHEINQTLHNLGLTTGLRYSLPTRISSSHADARLLTFYNSYQKISSFITLAYSIELPFDTGFGIHIGPSLQLQLHSSEDLSAHFQEKPVVFGLQLGASMNRP